MSSALRVLRHRDFRYLFFGQAASQIGDRAVVVALGMLTAGTLGGGGGTSLQKISVAT